MILSKFQEIVTQLINYAKRSALGLIGQNNELWANSFLLKEKSNPTDISIIRESFDRDAVNKAYVDEFEKKNQKVGSLVLIGLQSDLISRMARDLTQRYKDPIMILAGEAARRTTHGSNDGAISQGYFRYIKRLNEETNSAPKKSDT
jgi:hypothetical protein